MSFASTVANIAAGEVIKKLGAQSVGANELTQKKNMKVTIEKIIKVNFLKS